MPLPTGGHILFIYVLSLLFALVSAQDLSVPTSWRKPSTSRPLSERISISQDAINSILPQLDSATGEFNGIGYWQAGNVWTAIANHDHFAGTDKNKALVVNNLNTAFKLHAHYDKYGTTTMRFGGRKQHCRATEPIRTKIFCRMPLTLGMKSQTTVSSSVITKADANSKKQPKKNFSIAGSCNEATMAGGVFWRTTTDDQSINSITTGLYIATSALLAEITGDSKYTKAAVLSAQWIKAHNINANGIILDSVNGHDCTRSPSNWLFTYNSGKFIEGLSVLASVTKDSQWNNLMVHTVAAAVKSSTWQGSDGIITEGSSPTSNNDGVGFKSIFIRGLYEAFSRNPRNANLRVLLRSYVDVQYNALLDLAATKSTYSSSWHGPPQSFTTWGQLASLDVLGSAIRINS
ncbi:endo-1,6-alpha-mannosidase [Laccaria bicolor S238N-H82]|uniref:Endo-1,6-alpha-mannosidase n=1 Tax=Laccaria bicolor (strain S238N-H82 / ATCC MYA-4686) TaxID=486041 RepID=B0DJU6_LACBS|nr:endo-1,6-alpha-mannosidase [Laccaria bicolor S238N-H82]EDR05181.1 endo-1,6-alpha-mannosidase [Laccaria bicolor S238N-H82]|eukprot:XP_001884146.1 endo-1,6-alpha-mannosidase [Laccaria bicolor S238N-H82]